MDAKKSQWDSLGGTVQLYACHSGSNQQSFIDRSLSPSTYELTVANGMCVEPDRRTTPRNGIRLVAP